MYENPGGHGPLPPAADARVYMLVPVYQRQIKIKCDLFTRESFGFFEKMDISL